MLFVKLNRHAKTYARNSSRVSTSPVSCGLVSLESLLSEFLVASVSDGVHLESVGVGVDVMVLGEQVGDGVHGSDNAEDHGDDNLSVGNLGTTQVGNVLRDIMSHLRSGSGGAIIVLNHTVMELRRHGDNHVIEVGVEVSTFGDIKTERRGVMVTSQQVVGVVDQTWGVSSDLGEFRRPDTLVSILCLMDSHIWWPDSVMDLSLTVIPFLEEVTSVLLMTGMDLGEEDHLVHELTLTEGLVHKEIVLLMHGAVATLAGALPHLETSSQRG